MNSVAIVHVARRELGLNEDEYRALLLRETGQESAKGLTLAQVDKFVDAARRLGFKPKPKGKASARPSDPKVAKIIALWIAGHNLGLVRERGDTPLNAFVKRQTGIDRVQWAHRAADASKVIEALKGWLAREGGVAWPRRKRDWHDDERWRIVLAQTRRLAALDGEPRLSGALAHEIVGHANFAEFSAADWRQLMNALGERLRDAQASRPMAAGQDDAP